MITVIIVISTILIFSPMVIWLLRSIGIVHTKWRPGRIFNLVFKLSWLLILIGIGLLFLLILVV